MNPHDRLELLPLRQTVSVDSDAGAGFPRQGLLDWLSRADRYRIISHGSGGQILAASERGLAEARLVLRQAYGALVRFGIPTVHSYLDRQAEALMVPIMFLRVDAPRAHATELQHMLQERDADLREVDLQRDRVVVRAELELSRSLGLERAIEELTDGAVHILSWLVRYDRASTPAEPSPQAHVRQAECREENGR
jgi:hypothetical protein